MPTFAAIAWFGRMAAELVVHEKAVPPMIRVHNPIPYHGGTAHGSRKDASPSATANRSLVLEAGGEDQFSDRLSIEFRDSRKNAFVDQFLGK